MAKHKTIRQREAKIDSRLDNLGMCFFDLGGDAPAPDPLIGQSALANANISKEALDWYKNIYSESAPQREEATRIALDQARTQVDTARKQNEYADDTYRYTTGTYRPIERRIASDAQNYDTQERRDAEAGAAMADVTSAMAGQREALQRELGRSGVNPSSGMALSLENDMATKEALGKAAAARTARKSVEAIGAAKMADAAALGRGIAATNSTQTQLGLNAGNSAAGNAASTGSITAQGAGLMQNGYGTAIQGNNSAGQLMLGQYNAQTNATNAANSTTNALLGAAGSAAGGSAAGGWAAGGFKMSDKNMKTDRKKISGKAALADVKRLPATESWRYKKGTPADDGGRPHKGNMAQDVNRVLGDEAAPGGKVVNMEKMSAIGLAAIKEVAAGQKKIEQRLLRLEDAKPKKRA